MIRGKRLKVAVRALVFALAGSILWIGGADWLVGVGARGFQYVGVGQAPEAQAAIVLGAAVWSGGRPSPVLEDRLLTGVELYRAGKVKKLLLSGDHGRRSYDEVNAMRRFVVRRGVAERDVFMDHAGFSTYETMYRARDVFRVRSAIVVTQQFHLPRAVFLARRLGLDAVGVAADRRPYVGVEYLRMREVLARNKAVLDLYVLRSRPTFLGPAMPITGDGRATHD